MNSEQVRDIMKVALDLKPGESLSIEVPSKGQGLSLRTMFYKERLKTLQRGIAVNVSITSIEQRESGEWIAIFTYEEPLVITLHKTDGSTSMVTLDDRVSPTKEEEIPKDIKEILEKHREKEGGIRCSQKKL